MARQRQWDSLSEKTRARYSRWGSRNGVDARAYYEAGGSMTAARGHVSPSGKTEGQMRKARLQPFGVSQYRMNKLIQATQGVHYADRGETLTRGQFIRGLLASGMTPAQISTELARRRSEQHMTPAQRAATGRARWINRPKDLTPVQTRLYWYH